MKENKTSKEYLDNKACELADEQIEGVAGGVRPHNPCLECKHYKSLHKIIPHIRPTNAGSLKENKPYEQTDSLDVTGSLTSADDDSVIRSQRADDDSLTEKLRTEGSIIGE